MTFLASQLAGKRAGTVHGPSPTARLAGRKEYGVDGAVALIKRYREETDPAAQKGEDAPKRKSKTSKLEAKVESFFERQLWRPMAGLQA